MAGDADALRQEARRAINAGDLVRASHLFAAAAEAGPDIHAVHHDRGAFYKLVGRLEQAEASLRRAHALAPHDPRTRHALGTVLLSLGRYREGWNLYDARHEVPELSLAKPAIPFPEWQGEPVAGKNLLIFPEQGFGDQIQYARFAPWLQAQGADVTLMCLPALARLFQASLGVRVLAARGAVEFPDPDFWVMSSSIVGRAGLEADELPNASYLKPPPATTPSGARIGVATKGNPVHANDANRSLPPELAAVLMGLPGAISLHPEDSGAQDFADTASLIAGLELVVCVDTSVAHLAAAMGKPTWILLPKVMTDWRWRDHGERTPWYPSARLFRQTRYGDWQSVIEDVKAAL